MKRLSKPKLRKKQGARPEVEANLKTLQFLEDMRTLSARLGERSKLISLKIPENLLRAFRFACEDRNLKYQTQIKKLMVEWLETTKTQS